MSLASPVLAVRRAAQALAVAVVLAAEVSCDDTPEAPLKGPYIFLSPPSASISVGDSALFSATATGGLGIGGYRWTTSAPAVAAVSTAGVVRGLAPGRPTITVAPVARPSLQSAALVEVRAP